MAVLIQDLKRSHDFIDILFSNMNSALFIIDRDLKVQEFNNSFIDMFGVVREEVVGHLCGNVLGCVYTDGGRVNCGETDYCSTCVLRDSVRLALNEKKASSDLLIERDFLIKGQGVKKYFQFSCKPLHFEAQDFALLIVDDVTEKEVRHQEIATQNHIVRQYNLKFKEELCLAQKIQHDLIPKALPRSSEIHFAAQYISMDEIGGDLYDVFEIDEDTVGFYMCDVSGHGVPAALITVMMKVIVEESTHLKASPGEMVSHINKKVIDLFTDIYMTLFYGVFHKKTRQLDFVRAGHPQPILVRAGGYMSLLDDQAPLIGFDREIRYKANQVNLVPGDRIVLFTDGVFEARDTTGQMFENRLYAYLSDRPFESISKCLEGIVSELVQFVGQRKFDDDVCLLGIHLGEEEDLWRN